MPGHLTLEERDRIAQLFHQGASQAEIALALKRDKSTICRELERNSTGDDYLSGQAQRESERRRRERPIVRKMDDPEINLIVRKGLAQDWSPQQISGRLNEQEGKPSVSHQTIYDWIEQSPDREHWAEHLRRRGKRPCRPKKPGLPVGACIRQRPEVIEQRMRLGDFEGDTVLGPPGTGGVATLVDRKSRFTIIVKVQSKNADHVHDKIKRRLKELEEERCHSITFDNGTEFARCHRLEKALGCEAILCGSGLPVSTRNERKHERSYSSILSQGNRLSRHLPLSGT